MTDRLKRDRFLCIHGHFYQPPRENPWTGKIEEQQGAHPFHNWNERINAESYTPNAAARILDGESERVVNNYRKISFDFGPTLLCWLEAEARETYEAILEADRESQNLFSGHGSALAQVYHHSILPLCNARDKRTEIHWGRRDFESRFGRFPEGMWLAETAVDLETLDVLCKEGIQFTILSPLQAARIRSHRKKRWIDVSSGKIDPRTPYRVKLPSGREMSLFFYDKTISKAVAFERLLRSGEIFADRLLSGFSDKCHQAQLVNIATDGETYGHHHQFGEMALAYTLEYVDAHSLASVSIYGKFLESFPPTDVVEIRERSAWSCPHGLGRWSRDCGCQTGGKASWNQKWREPLRGALNWLRDQAAAPFEAELGLLLKEPWTARDDYIEVILDPSQEDRFYADHSIRSLSVQEKERARQLLELQRNALMMFTSCAWFFNDLSGIETIQVLRYAKRLIELGEELFQCDWEKQFLLHLSKAKSNIPEEGSGADIYRKHVCTSLIVDR
jgi:alpha-amylase/alpha-mannosidase (GH57 family)